MVFRLFTFNGGSLTFIDVAECLKKQTGI